MSSLIKENQAMVGREKIGMSAHFSVPELPVGTFDSLLTLSDDLAKADNYGESVCRKIVAAVTELCASNPSVGSPLGWSIDNTPIEAYLGNFSWDEKKFPRAAPLAENLQRIQTLLQRVEGTL